MTSPLVATNYSLAPLRRDYLNQDDEANPEIELTSYDPPPSTLPKPINLNTHLNDEAELELEIIKALKEESGNKDAQITENMRLHKIAQSYSKYLLKKIDQEMEAITGRGGDLEKMASYKKLGLFTSGLTVAAIIAFAIATGGSSTVLMALGAAVNAATGGLSAADYYLRLKHNELMGKLKVDQEERTLHSEQFKFVMEDIRKEMSAKTQVWQKLRLLLSLQQNIKME